MVLQKNGIKSEKQNKLQNLSTVNLAILTMLSNYLNVFAYFATVVKYVVSIYAINIFKSIFLHILCSHSQFVFILIIFAMLHGIIVHFLIKVKYSLVPFYISFFLQIKFCNIVIHLVAVWFDSWLITFKQRLFKNP